MDHISELRAILNGSFGWNKARITCFVKMLMALLMARTVNLNKIACMMSGEAEQESRYRRVTRFFASYTIDFDMIAVFIFKLFFITGGKWYLTMDRTNWMWGKSDINILTVAIAFKGTAIPIYWELLDNRCGNAKTEQRITIIQKFIDRFGKECIAGLLADREFIGHDWFDWLITEKIPFIIRLKNNLVTTNSRGKMVRVKELFRGMSPTEERILYNKRPLLGQEVYLSGLKLPSGEVLMVVTDREPSFAIKTYALRWEIETLFSCLKSRGFNFEETHITDHVRIKKLLALLAVALCWSHKTGEWRHAEVKPIKIKKHGRPAVSLFRYGLDYLVDILINLPSKSGLFKRCLEIFIPEKPDLCLTGFCP